MAQHFNIAVELNCWVAEVDWSVGKGRPTSWRKVDGVGKCLEVTISAPEEHLGKKLLLGSCEVPRELRSELVAEKKRLSTRSRQTEFEVILAQVKPSSEPKFLRLDPWSLREEFLSLEKSTLELVRFLRKCGQWSESSELRARFGWEATRLFLPDYFWADRKNLIVAMRSGTSNWGKYEYGDRFELRIRPEFPHLILSDCLCLEAIFHSVTIDLLRGVQFGVCARADCGKPFSFESAHKRKYCTWYCGHLVSVRQGRDQKRVQKPERKK